MFTNLKSEGGGVDRQGRGGVHQMVFSDHCIPYAVQYYLHIVDGYQVQFGEGQTEHRLGRSNNTCR